MIGTKYTYLALQKNMNFLELSYKAIINFQAFFFHLFLLDFASKWEKMIKH